MKQLYAPIIMFLLLIPFIGNANYTKHIITDETAPPCTADIITADQEICDNFFMISATPPEAGEAGAWTGPAGTSFVDVNDPTTFITNLNAGPNIITWTIFDSSGVPCDSDQITIINSQVITTPAITTPNNEEWCDEDGFEVTAQGPLLPGETGFWSGDAGQTFSNLNGLTTTVNDMQPGNNVIFWNMLCDRWFCRYFCQPYQSTRSRRNRYLDRTGWCYLLSKLGSTNHQWLATRRQCTYMDDYQRYL